MTKVIRAADLFCGAGGSSTGLYLAAQRRGMKVDLTAVNHWERAIETHSANHPAARHVCNGLDNVDPRKACGKLDLLIASPECTHHSVARGGKPADDQSRSTAWHVIQWADALRPKAIIVENVREFQWWGPLGVNGKPLKSKRGETFQGWANALRSIGYRLEYREMNSANYGDPTTRNRLFVGAVRGRGRIPWPEPTHSGHGTAGLFDHLPRWRAAREIIDWSIPGESIFGRKRPLSENTLKRIEAGLRKFCGLAFAFSLTHTGGDRLVDLTKPLPTITTAKRGEMGLVQPFVVSFKEGIERRVHSIDNPLPTQTTEKQFGLCRPFILPHRQFDGMQVDSVDEPLRTVTAQNGSGNAIVQPFIVQLKGTDPKTLGSTACSIEQPLRTLTTEGNYGLCKPFLIQYHGSGEGVYSVDEPLRTVDCRDRYALVLPDGRLLDILFRMLQPHELAAAMSFPIDYKFAGNKGEVVRQIGNAVPVSTATELCDSMLSVAGI